MRGLRAAVRAPTSASGGESLQDILRILQEEGFVHLAGEGPEQAWHWTSESYPADAISLRSITSDNFVVVDVTDATKVIGETDFTSGPSTLHPKAIYIVEGTLYQVERLDFEGRKAYVRQIDCDYYTDAITYDRVTVLDTFDRRGRGGHARAAPASDRTARSTSSRASSASRRSSSTRTRTSARASWICPSSRCTRRRTG